MNERFEIRNAGKADMGVIEALARRIWPQTYAEILTPEQLAYMLDYFYTPASLENQMEKLGHHFVLGLVNEVAVGFASWSKMDEADVYKLHKLYVDTRTQGKGVGKKLVEYIVEKLSGEKAAALRLNVNRHNKARHFYEKLGFAIIAEEDVDIGHGIYQVDYVMEKKLILPS